MSFHDRKLLAAQPRKKRSGGFFSCLARGFNDLGFNPEPPQIKLGTVADDWRAVGNDLRAAMGQIENCD